MSSTVGHVRGRVPRWLTGRYTGLTIVLLVLSVSSIAIGQNDLRKVVDAVAFTALLVLAIRIVGRRLRVATVVLVVPTLISHWIDQLSDSPIHSIVGLGLATVFLVFLTLVIMFAVFRDETVTFDTIFGAVCAYLLLGVTWGTTYALLVVISPDSLSVSPGLAHASGRGEPISAFTPVLQYYSFTTLATLGYGDVSPLSPGARALSVMEGLAGQLYLAVLVARLVGIHTARALKP
jgi:voltage-gated potassium channel